MNKLNMLSFNTTSSRNVTVSAFQFSVVIARFKPVIESPQWAMEVLQGDCICDSGPQNQS